MAAAFCKSLGVAMKRIALLLFVLSTPAVADPYVVSGFFAKNGDTDLWALSLSNGAELRGSGAHGPRFFFCNLDEVCNWSQTFSPNAATLWTNYDGTSGGQLLGDGSSLSSEFTFSIAPFLASDVCVLPLGCYATNMPATVTGWLRGYDRFGAVVFDIPFSFNGLATISGYGPTPDRQAEWHSAYITVVPEPATIALVAFGTGLLTLKGRIAARRA